MEGELILYREQIISDEKGLYQFGLCYVIIKKRLEFYNVTTIS